MLKNSCWQCFPGREMEAGKAHLGYRKRPPLFSIFNSERVQRSTVKALIGFN
jgi:hypothetical protein